MVGTTKMEFAPTILDPTKIPTGYEADTAKVNSKRAIAEALIQQAFSNDIPGWGGALSKIGNAWAGKSLEKQSEALAEGVNTKRTAEISDLLMRSQPAFDAASQGDLKPFRDLMPTLARHPELAEYFKPLVAAMTKQGENAVTGDPIIARDAQGNPINAVKHATGSITAASPSSLGPSADMTNVNDVWQDKSRALSGTLAPANVNDAVIHTGAPFSAGTVNPLALNAKLAVAAAAQPKFQYIPGGANGEPGKVFNPGSGNVTPAGMVAPDQFREPGPIQAEGGAHPQLLAIADATKKAFGINPTSSVRTAAQEDALHAAGVTRATGATSSHVDRPGNPAHGLDLPMTFGANEQEIKDKYAKIGITVTRATPESGKGANNGTGPHWHTEFALADQAKPTLTTQEYDKLPGEQQLMHSIDTMQGYWDKLHKQGGSLEEGGNVLDNTENYLAGTKAGRVVSNIAGTKSATVRTDLVNTRRQLAQAISKAAGMSARQMDSNVELQSWLDSLTDPTQSYQSATELLGNLKQNYGTKDATLRSFQRLGIPLPGNSLGANPSPAPAAAPAHRANRPPPNASPDDLVKFYTGGR